MQGLFLSVCKPDGGRQPCGVLCLFSEVYGLQGEEDSKHAEASPNCPFVVKLLDTHNLCDPMRVSTTQSHIKPPTNSFVYIMPESERRRR